MLFPSATSDITVTIIQCKGVVEGAQSQLLKLREIFRGSADPFK